MGWNMKRILILTLLLVNFLFYYNNANAYSSLNVSSPPPFSVRIDKVEVDNDFDIVEEHGKYCIYPVESKSYDVMCINRKANILNDQLGRLRYFIIFDAGYLSHNYVARVSSRSLVGCTKNKFESAPKNPFYCSDNLQGRVGDLALSVVDIRGLVKEKGVSKKIGPTELGGFIIDLSLNNLKANGKRHKFKIHGALLYNGAHDSGDYSYFEPYIKNINDPLYKNNYPFLSELNLYASKANYPINNNFDALMAVRDNVKKIRELEDIAEVDSWYAHVRSLYLGDNCVYIEGNGYKCNDVLSSLSKSALENDRIS